MKTAQSRAVPIVGRRSPLGSARAFAAAPHRFPAEIGHRNGGLACFRVLHKRLLAVTDPALVEQVLVTRQERYQRSFHYDNMQLVLGKGLLSTDGDEWQARRKSIAPLFRAERLRRVAEAGASAALACVARWETARRRGETVPLVAHMRRLTMAVIQQVLLGSELSDAAALRFSEAVQESMRLVRRRNTSIWNPPPWMPTPHNRRLHETRRILETYLREYCERCARTADAGSESLLQAIGMLQDSQAGGPPGPRVLLDEIKTLFTAGYETTSAALAWTLYLLARHPEVAEAWHAELDRVVQGGVPGWDQLHRLSWTNQVICEALRCYPPIYNMGRICVCDDDLGGYRIERGTVLLLSIYGVHHDDAWWPEPAAFRPERFADGAAWPRQAFLPFGAGKHLCVGAAFAMIEMKAVLAVIGSRYRVELVDDDPVEERADITLNPAREIPIRVVPRT